MDWWSSPRHIYCANYLPDGLFLWRRVWVEPVSGDYWVDGGEWWLHKHNCRFQWGMGRKWPGLSYLGGNVESKWLDGVLWIQDGDEDYRMRMRMTFEWPIENVDDELGVWLWDEVELKEEDIVTSMTSISVGSRRHCVMCWILVIWTHDQKWKIKLMADFSTGFFSNCSKEFFWMFKWLEGILRTLVCLIMPRKVLSP